ncbi:MAG TPA: ABC transporter ATP-binding protein [Candidatus Barnesiella excrementipullorum]|uniref:ABC transporter ATP-binding protein n=1 Tax=Candidatus Barnesiella excrementipullorum TaxID=2838479 RepID=A0A9D1VPK8_9BACT|nr:ABC transporter ATP-binding protein [Candidatus Barnesiella excrementipullorum]
MRRTPAISAQSLDIGYRSGKAGNIGIQRGLDIALYRGELTCLLGANGAGKSTLLRTLSGFQPPLGGTITVDGKPLDEIGKRDLSHLIGVVLTDRTSIGGLTAYEVAALGRQPHTGFFGRLSDADDAIVRNALAACGIAAKTHDYMASLSDGERQKVMIAKALAQECPIVILDEPTAFLDVVSRIEIMSLLHSIAAEQNRAILLSTHDIEQALVLGDRLWLLSREYGLQTGVTEDLILNGAFDRLFPHAAIHFDPLHGSFYPTVTRQRLVNVICPDDTLLHWSVNMLNRNGYTANITAEENCTPALLRIASPHDIVWDNGAAQIAFTSFEELTLFLKRPGE